jgi:hypothetical protein
MADLRQTDIRFRVEPRDVPIEKAARRLHLTKRQFGKILSELFSRGFPPPDATTGMFYLKAIDAWMDERHAPYRTGAAGRPEDPRQDAEQRLARIRSG